MSIILDEKLKNVIIVGDRVLIKPKSRQDKTASGLYLPPGVGEKEKINQGYVIKVGPGYPIPSMSEYDEPWKTSTDKVKYIPIQPEAGDLAVYLQSNCYDLEINKEKYVIVSISSILMLIRDESLLK